MSADAAWFGRPNVFEIDLGVVAANTRRLRRQLGAQTHFIATLKSHAYGYGVLPAARTVLAAGADALSMSNLDEAILLREAGIDVPILVYAGIPLDRDVVQAFQSYGLMPSLHDEEAIAAFMRWSTRRSPVAVKIEVGAERLGLLAEQAVQPIAELARHPNADLRLVHCHPNFRAVDGDSASLRWQFSRFTSLLAQLKAAGIEIPLRAMASSKVLQKSGTDMLLNAVDPGAALFAADDSGQYPLRSLSTRLIQARAVVRNQYLDEAVFPIRPGMRLGVIPIGYSDGFAHLHCGSVLVRGQRAAIVSAPSLEYSRIDLTDIAQAEVGDEVIIIGSQQGATITPQEVMQHQHAARTQDLVLFIGNSIRRVYRAES